MHGVTVPHRVGTIGGLWVHLGRIRTVTQRFAQILGKAVGNVDAETIHAFVAPESQDVEELLAHLGIVPVEVRLFFGEGVQVIPTIAARLPCGAAEVAQPVGRRQFGVFALAALEDVSGAFRRAGGRPQGLLKPFMLIGSVIRHNIDDDVDAGIV